MTTVVLSCSSSKHAMRRFCFPGHVSHVAGSTKHSHWRLLPYTLNKPANSLHCYYSNVHVFWPIRIKKRFWFVFVFFTARTNFQITVLILVCVSSSVCAADFLLFPLVHSHLLWFPLTFFIYWKVHYVFFLRLIGWKSQKFSWDFFLQQQQKELSEVV